MWPQPLIPIHSTAVSALVAAVPLILVLILMGWLQKSALFASACGLFLAGMIAVGVWHMPVTLALWSVLFGFLYAVWPVLWIVFTALWLYNLSVQTGSFDQLRRWITHHASGDPCVQVILVAFCFGALLESCAGFGVPVAVTAFLLAGLGFERRKAAAFALIANTAPVGFGGMGLPILTLAGVTGLETSKLSAMVGRQLPLLSFILPFYLVWLVARGPGLRRTWPAALVAGMTFAVSQFLISNYWGPYSADIISTLASIGALVAFLRIWKPLGDETTVNHSGFESDEGMLSRRSVFRGWLPWTVLSLVMVVWSLLKLFESGQSMIPIPHLHREILITLYGKPYAALYTFQPLAVGTAVLVATVLSGLSLRVRPRVFLKPARDSMRQLGVPAITIMSIIGLAYLYNYSGMTYTLGAAAARLGRGFPLASGYLGWLGCFLSGSDAATNILFGNLQVATAHQLHLNPVLLAATNSSGGVVGKMISPQNIAVGVSTVGLIGQEGAVLRSVLWPSILLITMVSILAYGQAYWFPSVVP